MRTIFYLILWLKFHIVMAAVQMKMRDLFCKGLFFPKEQLLSMKIWCNHFEKGFTVHLSKKYNLADIIPSFSYT